MSAVIQVAVRSSYGNERIYPTNADAVLLTRLVGTKTLSLDNLRTAFAMGHKIQLVDGFSSHIARDIVELTEAPRTMSVTVME